MTEDKPETPVRDKISQLSWQFTCIGTVILLVVGYVIEKPEHHFLNMGVMLILSAIGIVLAIIGFTSNKKRDAIIGLVISLLLGIIVLGVLWLFFMALSNLH